jgi:hypothetical protein
MDKESKIPNAFEWFSKLKLTKFIPWHFDSEIDFNSSINKQFKIECRYREVLTFGHRQDQDTFAGFEVINGKIMGNVLVFHPSFKNNIDDWNIVEFEYENFFEFMKNCVLEDMKEWIEDDDINDYL